MGKALIGAVVGLSLTASATRAQSENRPGRTESKSWQDLLARSFDHGKLQELKAQLDAKPDGRHSFSKIEYAGHTFWLMEVHLGDGIAFKLVALYAPEKDKSYRQCLAANSWTAGHLDVKLNPDSGLLEVREAANSRLKGQIILSINLRTIGTAHSVTDMSPPPAGQVIDGELGQRLDAAVQKQDKPFWGVVLVARNGKPVLAKGYGFANLESKPNSPRMLFDIGSTSKSFTAAAILKLEEQGKLRVSDTIDQHLDRVPSDKSKITIHQLLTHTSGIPADINFTGVMLRDREPMTAAVLAAPLQSKPDEAFVYTNPGYFLLAAIVERASKQPFESYVKENVFVPAGMTSTVFLQDPAVDRSLETQRVLRRATGAEAAITDRASWYAWSWGFRGATGIVTSADDLLRWDAALRGEKVLGQVAKDKFFRVDKANYACGWFVDTAPDGGTIQHHGGSTRGYLTDLARYPKHSALIVVLTNEDSNARAVRERLQAILLEANK